MTPRDEAPVTVTQADREFRVKLLGHIIESLDRPCSEGDMIDDRTDALDALIAEFRTQSAAASRAELEAEKARHRETLAVLQTAHECEAASRAEVDRLREALESIAEYWNRDRNDMAMHNACWHAVNTAEDALTALSASDGEAG